MPKVALVSLGCPKNLVDSEDLLAALAKEGFRYSADASDAEVVLVNTCGFIEEAKRESIEEILKLRHIKEEGKRLLVFGCLAKRYGKELANEIPEIDAVWGVGEEDKIVEYCKLTVKRRRGDAAKRRKRFPASPVPCVSSSASYRSVGYAYLKIAEGCSRGCAYCVIPSIRGPYRSLEPDKILGTAERHIRSGVKELVVVAQDTASYGREFKGYDLPALIKDISSIEGDFWVRLLYLYPSSISDKLISAIAGNEKICKYLDIPLQHSEDDILRAMGRSGTRRSYTNLIGRIREAVPDAALRTTFMVGFPGESEEDFMGLRNFVEEMRFERLGVFTYSKEEGTRAAKLKGSVPPRAAKMRRDKIMKLQSRISLEKNMSLVGKRLRAIVDEVGVDAAVARLSSQAPEIDGVVLIKNDTGTRGHGDTESITGSGEPRETPRRRAARSSRRDLLKAGEFINVEIKDAYDYDLKGEVTA